MQLFLKDGMSNTLRKKLHLFERKPLST
jgi:tRNA pseudouridine13 synthase